MKLHTHDSKDRQMMIAITKPINSLNLYEQYRPLMKTGDLIVFDGCTGFSKLMKLLTDSKYFHIGMVLRDCSSLFGESLLMIESTAEIKLTDVGGCQIMKGAQLHFLSRRLLMDAGLAYWVPLKTSLSEHKLEQMLCWLRNIDIEKVPYNQARACGVPLAKIEDICGTRLKMDYNSIFSAELVTQALQVANVIDSHIDPNNQTPADVVGFNCFEKPVLIHR